MMFFFSFCCSKIVFKLNVWVVCAIWSEFFFWQKVFYIKRLFWNSLKTHISVMVLIGSITWCKHCRVWYLISIKWCSIKNNQNRIGENLILKSLKNTTIRSVLGYSSIHFGSLCWSWSWDDYNELEKKWNQW